MQIFPTRYSTLASDALNEFISERYGLNDTSCRLLIRNVSDTYVIENQTEKYIFKIYRDAHRKLDEIEGEAELLAILNDRGASISYPVADLSGTIIQSFNAAEGTRYGMLFTYAKGNVVNVMNDVQLATLGRAMATVHNITSSIQLNHKRIEFNIDTTIIQPLETIKPAFAALEEEYADLLSISKTVMAKLNEFDFTNFSYGYCHYDFLPKNFHFEEDSKLTFFDFDFAGKGYLANDITSLYIHYFMEVFMNRQTREQADSAFAAFVESYREVRPLHSDELKVIPYLGFGFWVFYLGFQYDNFEDWSNIFFGPKFLKDRAGLIKKWMAYFED